MTTDMVVRTAAPVALSTDQLQYISGTEFVPPGLRGNLPAILACVATGRELGIGDMVSLKSIHIIDGKASFSAELMVMLARRSGHSITGEVKDGAAVVTGKRGDNGDTITVTWTREMAEQAGLLGKQNWRKYEASMLWARAASQLCRMLFADCFAGQTYTPEEIGAEFTDSVGDPMAVEPTPAPVPQADGAATVEPASPTETPVDMSDPDIPFGDAVIDGVHTPPAVTAPQLKKLGVLIGKYRDGVNLTSEHLYRAVRRDPATVQGAYDEAGVLHLGPLLKVLSKAEATELIDRLERYAVNRDAVEETSS